MKKTLETIIEETICDTTSTITTPDLPMIDLATQESLGTLPRVLCRLYLLTRRVLANEDKQWSDTDATEMCRTFGKKVTNYFGVPHDTEFDICANFEVARELKTSVTQKDLPRQVVLTKPPKLVTVCRDFSSY